MTEPQTPQEWNETDLAAAFWALNKLCDDRKWGYLIEREPEQKQISVEFSSGDKGMFFGRSHGYTEQEAIRHAIVGAAG